MIYEGYSYSPATAAFSIYIISMYMYVNRHYKIIIRRKTKSSNMSQWVEEMEILLRINYIFHIINKKLSKMNIKLRILQPKRISIQKFYFIIINLRGIKENKIKQRNTKRSSITLSSINHPVDGIQMYLNILEPKVSLLKMNLYFSNQLLFEIIWVNLFSIMLFTILNVFVN